MSRYLFKLCFLCFLIGKSISLNAQEIFYSKYEGFDFRSGEFSVVGKVGDRLYVYRGSSQGYYLDAYDSKMKRLATVVLDFLPERVMGTKFITYKDKMIVLYQVSEGNSVLVFATVLDNKGRISKEIVKVDEVHYDFLGGRSGLYNYAISDDKQVIGIYGVGLDKNVLKAKVVRLDTALQIDGISNASFEADNNISFGEGLMTNRGDFLLPAFTPTGSRRYADRVWLLSLTEGSQVFESAELPLNNMYAAGTYMELDKSGKTIYIGGFYSDRKSGHYSGILYTAYNVNTRQFDGYKEIPFSERLRNAAGGTNKKRAFNDYSVKHLVVKNNGGFVMVAEDSYITTRNNYSQGMGYYSWYYPSMSVSVREYNFGDIMCISYNGEGEQEWVSFIRKYQYSQEDGGLFSSFALVNTGGSLGCLFNDFNISRSRIQLGSISAGGSVSVRALTGFNSEEPDWLPRSGKQVSVNEFVTPCLRRNQICFAKIVF